MFNRCASERVDGTVNLERCPSGRCGCSSKVFRETRSDFEPNHVLKACGTKAKKRHIFQKIMVCWLQGHKTICLKIYMFLHWYPKPSNKHVAKYNFKLRLSLQIVVRAPRRCTEQCYPVCFIARAPFRSTCSPFRSARDKALRVFFCFDRRQQPWARARSRETLATAAANRPPPPNSQQNAFATSRPRRSPRVWVHFGIRGSGVILGKRSSLAAPPRAEPLRFRAPGKSNFRVHNEERTASRICARLQSYRTTYLVLALQARRSFFWRPQQAARNPSAAVAKLRLDRRPTGAG